MFSSTRAVCALLLVALLALPSALAAAGSPAPHAHPAKGAKKGAKKRACPRQGRRATAAKKRSCPRRGTNRPASTGKVPPPYTPLKGPDNLIVNVVKFQVRGKAPQTAVRVSRGNVETTCAGQGIDTPYTHAYAFTIQALLTGTAFHEQITYPQGNYTRVEGHFVNDRKATGTLWIGDVPGPNGGVCNSGPVPFTATR
ncbi:MAG: hypothetical protein WBC33_07920 [Conexibacter sp.]